MARILLTHLPDALENDYGPRALAELRKLGEVKLREADTPHSGGLTPPAIEHQSLETVAQAADILKGRVPRGAVNADHWTRRELLRP